MSFITVAQWVRLGTTITHYVMVADQASLVLTGVATPLALKRMVGATSTTLVLTGQPAALLKGRAVQANPGSLLLTGQVADFGRAYILQADPTTLQIGALDAGLIWSAIATLFAEPAELRLTPGDQAALTHGLWLHADPGTLLLGGEEVALLLGRAIQAELLDPTLWLTGLDVEMFWMKVLAIDAEPGHLEILGLDAEVRRFRDQTGWDTLLHPPVQACRSLLSEATHPRGTAAAPLKTNRRNC